MKLAKISDYKRALDNRKKSDVPCLTGLDFSGLPGFSDTKIVANATFAAICGGTGVGKTTLLEMMYASLSGQTFEKQVSARLGVAKASIKFTHPSGDLDRAVDVAGIDHSNIESADDVTYIGLPERTSYSQAAFVDTDVEILKEGVSSYMLDDKLRSLCSMICRKDYQSIKVYEIESVGDKVNPFFVIETPASTYDSRALATGEISVLHLAWALNYSKALSIVLIEEPEAYLPPLSHSFVFAMLAYMAVTKKISFFFTTHSTEIASSLAASNLICIRTEGAFSVASSSPDAKMRVLSRLGLAPQQQAVIFVEDDLAIVVLNEILALHEFNVAASIEVVRTDGSGSSKKAIEAIPTTIESVKFLAALDGDMRAEAANWPCVGSLTFLPFRLAMEIEFIAAIESKLKQFCNSTGRAVSLVQDALADSKGSECHDRFSSIASDLSMKRDEAALYAFRLWLTLKGNRAVTLKFVNDLSAKLDIALPNRVGKN